MTKGDGTMSKKGKITDAADILKRRYVRDSAERVSSLQEERVNAKVAQLIYDLRKGAGLSQKDLAERIETTQSVISRLEDADYDGHSLSMLSRIAKALSKQLSVLMTEEDPTADETRFVFREVVKNLRRRERLSIASLAKAIDLEAEEIVAMERHDHYRPSPLVLHKLSRFYEVSQVRLAALAGAVSEVPDDLREEASRFAAQSQSFAKLTKEEKRVLDEFVKVLKE
jgi:ribosome-binding protein aMBF1 (putative translation factor)